MIKKTTYRRRTRESSTSFCVSTVICIMIVAFTLGVLYGRSGKENLIVCAYSGIEDKSWCFPFPIKTKITYVSIKDNILSIYGDKVWHGKLEPVFMGSLKESR